MNTPSQYAVALLSALASTSSEQHPQVLDRFAQVLAEDHQVEHWPQIAEAITAAALPRTARVAHADDRTLLQPVVGPLGTVAVDGSLIAGAVVQVGERRVDASIAGRLAQLRQALRGDESGT